MLPHIACGWVVTWLPVAFGHLGLQPTFAVVIAVGITPQACHLYSVTYISWDPSGQAVLL